MTARKASTTSKRAITSKRATTAKRATAANTRGRRQSTAAGSVAACLPTSSRRERDAARRKFDCGILGRDEAVGAGKSLPSGATHEIVGLRRDGSPLLKRRRFSAR